MPTFRTTLPPEEAHRGFDLRRTPQTATLQAIVTCEDLIVCDTHYYGGRTIPCERAVNDEGKTTDDATCKACRDKIAWRTHAYVSCYDVRKAEHFIFECTCHAAKPLQDYRQATTSLRGCVISARRPKGTPNGKVTIETGTANLQKVRLPAAPDLPRALAVIWRLPITPVDIQSSRPDTETHRVDQPAARRVRHQPDNAGDDLKLHDPILAAERAPRQKASA